MKERIEVSLEKNIHMGDQRLQIRYGDSTYSGIIESGYDSNTLKIWLKDLKIPKELETEVRFKIFRKLTEQGYNCIFLEGSRV